MKAARGLGAALIPCGFPPLTASVLPECIEFISTAGDERARDLDVAELGTLPLPFRASPRQQ